MHKFITLCSVLVATATSLASPIRDDLAAKSISYADFPAYENLWTWPTDMIRCSPAVPSTPHGFNFDTWYCMVAANGYTHRGAFGNFTEDSVTTPRNASGYYCGRLLPLDSGTYQLSWCQDGYSAVAATTYEWTGSAWKYVGHITGNAYRYPGAYSTSFTVEEDGLAVALLFTANFYAPEGTEVTFTDIELIKID